MEAWQVRDHLGTIDGGDHVGHTSDEQGRIEGKVVSYSANLGMLALMESVTWNDQPACSPGFYLLPPEK